MPIKVFQPIHLITGQSENTSFSNFLHDTYLITELNCEFKRFLKVMRSEKLCLCSLWTLTKVHYHRRKGRCFYRDSEKFYSFIFYIFHNLRLVGRWNKSLDALYLTGKWICQIVKFEIKNNFFFINFMTL